MQEATIDFEQLTDERKIHELLNEKVFHIDFYGHNLNALHDTLSGLAKRPYKVIFKNISKLPLTEGSRFEVMLSLFVMNSSRIEKMEETVNFYFEN